MNLFGLFLLLPIVCVISTPGEYEVKHSEMHKLPNEFWSHHFGPDFQHAIHFDLQQTDLIDTTNIIQKHLSESKDGNKKRSACSASNPTELANRQHGSSMRVHLLQPNEIEALEKEMVNYAKGNKMAESPVVVNLPATEGSTSKNENQEPIVLSVPPVVYHGNPNMIHSYYSEKAKNAWSHNNKYPVHDSMQKLQPSYVDSQYERQPSHDSSSKNPPYEEVKQTSYEEKNPPLFEDVQDSTDANQEKTA